MSVRWNVLTNDEQIGLAAGVARVSTSKPDLLQMNPLFNILNELGTSWEDLFLRIPIVLKYVIFRMFSTITLSLSFSTALPLSTPGNIAEINNNNNDISDKNNRKDIILKNSQILNSTVEDARNSLLVLQSSILLFLENMVKMGVTRSQLGDKAILAISETVYAILKSPSFSFPTLSSPSSFSTSTFSFSSTSISTSPSISLLQVDSLFSLEYNKLLQLLEFSIKNGKNDVKLPQKLNSNKKLNILTEKTKVLEIKNNFENIHDCEIKNKNEKSISEFHININEINSNNDKNQNNVIEEHFNEIWIKKMNAIFEKLCL